MWKLPASSWALALSGLVLAQVGYNVGTRPAMGEGDAAVVIGDGLVGHWSAQVLAHRGARVMLVGRHDDRLSRFERGPRDRTLNSTVESASDAARLWAPEGIQVVADTAGSVDSMEALYPFMRTGGQLVSAGFCGTSGLIDIQRMRERELTLHTPSGWTRPRMDATLELIVSGIIKTEPLITHRFPASQAAEAFDLILRKREPVLGVVLDWEGL
ncbi:MAG: zinc-binding dehydrogenase [Chloroflexi bacterium]|nr:zinc-binding dehydrogenase [Chloroflexota bacterium]